MKIRTLLVAVATLLSMLMAGNAHAAQPTHVTYGAGAQECPKAYLCLYQHHHFNIHKKGWMLIVDDSIHDLGKYRNPGSYKNKMNGYTMLYSEIFYRGHRMPLPAHTMGDIRDFDASSLRPLLLS